LGIGAVESDRGHLLRDDPVLDARVVYTGVALELMKQQVDLVGDDAAEVIDILFPPSVEG
jgi:hypothetical protein